MPVLIQNVTGSLGDNLKGNTMMFESVSGQFGYSTWFKIGYLEVFIQNLKKVIESENLNKSRDFGMNTNTNKIFKEVKVSY